MKLETMRRIDFWIGIPLCFLCTLWLRIAGTRKGPEKPARILFIELSEMGSTILANPALERAKSVFGSEIFFLIFEHNAESVRLLPTVPEPNIRTIRVSSLLALTLDSFRFLRWCPQAGIDTVIDLELFSRFSALLAGLSRARRRVGFHRFRGEGLYRGEILTHRVSYNGHVHMAKNFLAMVEALRAPADRLSYCKTFIADDEVRVPQPEIEQARLRRMEDLVRKVYPAFTSGLHRIVLINPNSSELLPQRRWPRDNYSTLARRIVDEWEDALVLITGSAAEREEAIATQNRVNHPRIRSVAGMHSLRDLIALYHLATVLVTNDSGPAHFSAITPIRSIVLFGPETPSLYGSLGDTESIFAGLACSPCVNAANKKNSACDDPVCMQAITPERVLASVREALNAAERL
jgi:ADP-heptose:LPS heptosyltransferase